ncbi:MAG: hypothetical protein IH819_12985 [Bacteroidetes bacterium]|nr:hypothetical protein [Bacteroidota bacterium]
MMWDYALQMGHIKDEEEFLLSITERQDICMNMTKLSDEEIMNEIKKGGKELNELLELGLSEDRYVRTGNPKNYKARKKWKNPPLDPENIERNENDFSFNYSATEFKYEETASSTSS